VAEVLELSTVVGGHAGSRSDAVAGRTHYGGSGFVRHEPQANPASDGAFDELADLVLPELFATDFDGDHDMIARCSSAAL
jgi:hypothetical protein